MKITRFDSRQVEMPLVEGYRIAGRHFTSATNFIVEIETDTGLTGHGCAAPAEDITGESNDTCGHALSGVLKDRVTGVLLPDDPGQLGLELLTHVPSAPAACAAVDMALWDLASQAAGKPLVEYLGGKPEAISTSVTIGICDAEETIRQAQDWIDKGFRILKVKTGDSVIEDVSRIVALRMSIGNDVLIRVDANEGYSFDEAQRFLNAVRDLNIEMLEQPLAARDLDAAMKLRQMCHVPLMADESAISIADAERVAEQSAADGINIKLMKCGGLSAARQIHDHAQAQGLSLMLGCNDETRISIAAALHFAQAMPGVRYIDLDGHMDLAQDVSTGGFTIKDGLMSLTTAPGIGVSLIV